MALQYRRFAMGIRWRSHLGKIDGIGNGGCLEPKERYPGSMSHNNFMGGDQILAIKDVIRHT
jgi:hypothetical protein